MDVLMIADTTPAWASGASTSQKDWYWLPPANPSSYGTFAAKLAKRYGNGGTFWAANPTLPVVLPAGIELWNEENTRLQPVLCLVADGKHTCIGPVAHDRERRQRQAGLGDGDGSTHLRHRRQLYVRVHIGSGHPGQKGGTALAGYPWAGGFYWYDIRDDFGGTSTTNIEAHFGAVMADNHPKPVYHALQTAWSG
jgi:hypothetical protein